MNSQDDDSQQRFALGLVFALIALVVAFAIGMGIHQRNKLAEGAVKPVSAAAAVLPAVPAPANDVAQLSAARAAADAASVRVENGVVKFYFASGKADLAAGAGEALAEVIKAATSGRKLLVSGFHDATGSAAKNAELAKTRAIAVKGALTAAGVPETSITLKKPEQMKASGSDAEARRVEVRLE